MHNHLNRLAAMTLLLAACGRDSTARVDTAFAALQERGKMAMGVDQYTSSHTFDITPTGGRVTLQRDSVDSLGIEQIRAHMKMIRHSFEAGDFTTPGFVHQRTMPGTEVMSRKKSEIAYTYEDLPRGGAVVITTSDAEAKAAIGEFMRAQRGDHHAGGSH